MKKIQNELDEIGIWHTAMVCGMAMYQIKIASENKSRNFFYSANMETEQICVGTLYQHIAGLGKRAVCVTEVKWVKKY